MMDPQPSVPVCVDASLVAAVLLGEPAGANAGILWDGWVASERRLISAPQFAAESVSAIRRAQIRKRMSAESARSALRTFLDQMLPDIEVMPGSTDTWRRAWEWAEELGRSGVYDTIYLAVAEEAGAEFWTADGNLYRALGADGRPVPDWVHLVEP